MNGRLYDPAVGRFLSADPVVQDAGNTQSYNRYSYCLNNPLKYTDPSGYTWWDKFWNWMDKNQIQIGINMGPRGLTPNVSAPGPDNTRMALGYNIQSDRVGFGNNSSGFMQFYFPQIDYDISEKNFVNKTFPNLEPRYGNEWRAFSNNVWSWAKDHFYVGAEYEITYGEQLALNLDNGVGFNIAPVTEIVSEGKYSMFGSRNTGKLFMNNDKNKVKINDYGLYYYVGANFSQTIDYSSSYRGIKTNTISVGAIGLFGVTLNYSENWNFIGGYSGIEIGGKVAAIWGVSGNIRVGFEF